MKALHRTILLLAVLFSTQLFTQSSLAADKVNQSVDLGGNRQATWYLPDQPAEAWIFLQHGFQRNKGHLDDIATEFMDNGFMVLTVNSSVTGGNKSLARQVADDMVDAMPAPPNGVALPNKLILGGHSAGGLFVTHVGARLIERGYSQLAGTLLFDPVDKDNAMQPSMEVTVNSGVPLLSILANSGSCNASNNALNPLRNLSAAFVGIKLTDNSKHMDVEGDSTGGIGAWICGSPKAHNIAYLQDFAVNWAKDMAHGTTNAAYYPGGSKINALLQANDGILIKELATDPPVAEFSFAVNGFGVQFTDASYDSDGSIDSWDWDFGDGQDSTEVNPFHNYGSADTYSVTLTVTDDSGQSASTTKTVTIVPDTLSPNADFTFTTSGLQASFTDASTDNDGSIVAYSWDFGDGNSSTQENPTHIYSADGTYTVTLTVTDNDGLTDSETQQVTVSGVIDEVLENGDVLSGLSGAQGQELHFRLPVPAGATDLKIAINGGSGDADLYVRFGAKPTTSNWDYRPYKSGNNETVNVASPQSGDWYLMLRGYRAFSGVTLSVSFTGAGSNMAPTAAFSYTVVGSTVNFTDESTDSDGYIQSRLWEFGDGGQSTQANPSHTFSGAGPYTVTLRVSDDDNATDAESKTISLKDGVTPLENGVSVHNLSGITGQEHHFVLTIPEGSVDLKFVMQGGTGDADIYIRHGAQATESEWDYRPYKYGNNETVEIPQPQGGQWFVMVRGYNNFSGVSLTPSVIDYQ